MILTRCSIICSEWECVPLHKYAASFEISNRKRNASSNRLPKKRSSIAAKNEHNISLHLSDHDCRYNLLRPRTWIGNATWIFTFDSSGRKIKYALRIIRAKTVAQSWHLICKKISYAYLYSIFYKILLQCNQPYYKVRLDFIVGMKTKL